jgi:uncharacterized protein (DUF305 family)
MPDSRAFRIPSILILAVLAAACAGAGGGSHAPSRPGPASSEELEALYRARVDSSRTRFTPADAEFMTGMIAHHAQALTMAALAPTHGANPTIQTLAARIENSQNDEIRWMQRWLRDRGLEVPEVMMMDGEVMVHGAMHDMSMPGMLTPRQMEELKAARGAEFDRLFLTFMIQHHTGAVEMVRVLFNTDGAGQDEAAFKLASDVQVDQKTEIARMEQLLSRLPPR